MKGWNDNSLSVEELQWRIPRVNRMIEIVENDLPVSREAALYFKANLFHVKTDTVAEAIFDVIPVAF